MKKLYTLFITLLFISGLSAQSTIGVYDKSGNDMSGQTITYWVPFDSTLTPPIPYFEYKDFVDVVNESSTSMTIKIIREEVSIIPGTQDYLCWGNTCFAAQASGTNPVWLPNDSIVLAPNDTAGSAPGSFPLQVYFQNYNQGPPFETNPRTYKIGEATYRYDFFDAANASNTASIFVKHSVSYLTSVNENLMNDFRFQLYPNPSTDYSFIELSGIDGEVELNVMVRNMLGQEMDLLTVPANTERMKIEHEDYQKGIYFVSVLNEGKILSTKKLVVK